MIRATNIQSRQSLLFKQRLDVYRKRSFDRSILVRLVALETHVLYGNVPTITE